MPAPRKHFERIKVILTERGEMRCMDLAVAAGVNVGTLKAAVACPVRDGELVKRTEGRAVFYSLGDGTPPTAPDDASEDVEEASDGPKFNAALWADGDLVLWNVELNDDGRSLTLSADQVQLLCRLLHGQGPAE